MTFSRIYKKIYRAFELCPLGKNDLFQVHLIEHIDKIPAKFNEMLEKQSNVFLRTSYLHALEASKPHEMHFAYACIEKDKTPVAFMYFQFLKVTLDKADDFLNPRYFGKELEDISKKKNGIFFKNVFNSPFSIMFCGNVFLTGEHGIYINPVKRNAELMEALPLLIQDVIDKAGEDGKIAGVVVKDFYDDKTNDIPDLEKKGYRKFYFEPNMHMNIRKNWNDFDDYLDDLSSKYRVRAKNVYKKTEDIVTKVFSEKEILTHAKDIDRIYQNVHLKAAVHFSGVHATYFSNLKNKLRDNFSFKAFYLEDKMVAFSTMIYGPGYCEAHLVGLDYDFNKSHSLYPFLLYEYLRDAINKKASVIHFGRTAREIKSTVGAKAFPVYCYIGLQSPLSMKVLSPFISSSKEKEIIERDPFKEMNAVKEQGLKV